MQLVSGCVKDSDLCKLAHLQVPALPECPLGKRLHLQLLQPVWQRHRPRHQLRQHALHICSTAHAREGFRGKQGLRSHCL